MVRSEMLVEFALKMMLVPKMMLNCVLNYVWIALKVFLTFRVILSVLWVPELLYAAFCYDVSWYGALRSNNPVCLSLLEVNSFLADPAGLYVLCVALVVYYDSHRN